MRIETSKLLRKFYYASTVCTKKHLANSSTHKSRKMKKTQEFHPENGTQECESGEERRKKPE